MNLKLQVGNNSRHFKEEDFSSGLVQEWYNEKIKKEFERINDEKRIIDQITQFSNMLCKEYYKKYFSTEIIDKIKEIRFSPY